MIAVQLFIVRATFVMIACMIAIASFLGGCTAEGIEHKGEPDCPETTHSWWGRGTDDRDWDGPLPAVVQMIS